MADVLGSFEQAVLLAVVRLGDGAYGRAILKEVEQRLEREVAPGAVHATLERLERKKLTASRLGSGTPVRDGPSRRFYIVLPAGVQALNDARDAMNRMWRGMPRRLSTLNTRG
jgi:DNA-binding PadR family transcriptional regulator